MESKLRASRAGGLESRERLLSAAIDCIAEYGCSGATTSRIADRAGVSRGSLQHHFQSREALLLAVADRVSAHDRPADIAALTAAPFQDRLDYFLAQVDRSSLSNNYAAATRMTEGLDRTSDLGARIAAILAAAVRANQQFREHLFPDVDLRADDWLAIVRTLSATNHAATFHLQTSDRVRGQADHDLMRTHQRGMLRAYIEQYRRR